MAAGRLPRVLSWAVIVPVLAIVLLPVTWGHKIPALLEVVVALALAGAVLAAVNHAEIVAHRVGEPFGSLVLAIAVTIIEVGLIVTLMVSGGLGTASLARDTVFAAVMITCNGIVGIALLIGALRFHITVFNAEGSGAALATVITLATLSLVLPTFRSVARVQSSLRRSSLLRRSHHWCCTRCSWLPRPYDTGTSSFH